MDSARAVAGTVGRLELAFERRGARTVLARGYAEPPFRVGPASDVDGAAYLILVCTGPGVFGGDSLRQTVDVGRGARVRLTSQSALQIHPSVDRACAEVTQTYRIDEDGELHAEWDPAIPFAAARFDQRIDVDLARGGRLFWSDAVMSGRAGRGETWRFGSFAHQLRLRRAGALVYLERYRLAPDRRPAQTWLAGGAHYAGTTVVVHEAATEAAAADLQSVAASISDVSAGVDCVQDGVVVARLLSPSGVAFAAARDAIRSCAQESIFRRAAAANRK